VLGLVIEPLVVVVDGDREDLLGVVLADDVFVELPRDLARRWNLDEQLLAGAAPPSFLIEDRLA